MAEEGKCFQAFGYPDEQFETVISESLHCGICSCVFNDPVMCKNEHCFCRGCITKHLENYHTCPCCNQDLTVETLADAPRFFKNLLSEQRIRCDHHKRGCQEIVQLGNLASHVAVCGKAPVLCENEECSSEINREDQFRHQNEECRFRDVTCRNCKEMSSMVQEIGTSVSSLHEQVANLNTEIKTGLTAVKNRLEKMDKHEAVYEMENAPSDQATPSVSSNDPKDPTEYAYVVAGGYGEKGKLLSSAEIFDKTSNSWIPLKPIKTSRAEASSVVYKGQVLVTGGTSYKTSYSREKSAISSIEQLNRHVNPLLPPNWSLLSVNLPRALRGHGTVLYNDQLIVVGGYDEEKKSYSDIIYEVQLHFPFTTKVLAKLPYSRSMGGVVLVNDKILIIGGCNRYDAVNNVTMYDIIKNEVKELEPLPYKVCNMATVKFGETVVLAGGNPRNNLRQNVKNTVISYNIETQKSTELPAMKNCRSECCAVVDESSLVVMGGRDEEGNPQSSVEIFDFKTFKWSNFPSMNETRCAFIAEIV